MALNRNFFTTLRFVQGRSAWFCKRQLSSMRAWVVRDFSEGIALETDLRVPEITHPNHVLIKVEASVFLVSAYIY